MFEGLLGLQVADGPVPVILFTVAAVIAAVLLVRRPTRRWLLRIALAVVVGAVAAVATWLVCIRWLNLFGESLGSGNYAWITAAFIGVALALVSLRRRPLWPTVVAVAAVPTTLPTITSHCEPRPLPAEPEWTRPSSTSRPVATASAH